MLDKPAGITSHTCVARVRRAYGLRRVGHGGTLDPAVTGVLPIALGPATRLLPYLRGDKTYEGAIQLGVRTRSDDLEGEVVSRSPLPNLERSQLELALDRFRGEIQQTPPQVSAIHVEGERAYVRARRGERLALAPRPVTVHALELVAWEPASGRLRLRVRCSAGTYIRSLARDLGEALGCGGALASLRRTEALGFDLGGAIPLARLEEPPSPPLQDPLGPLAHLPQQRLEEGELSGWRCGRALQARGQDLPEQPLVILTPDGRLAGIARVSGPGVLQPRLVFDAAG